MGTMASQIISLTIVYSIVYSGADERKHQSYASLAFVRGNSPVAGEFPAQMASKAENDFIWWRHHDKRKCYLYIDHHNSVILNTYLQPAQTLVANQFVSPYVNLAHGF